MYTRRTFVKTIALGAAAAYAAPALVSCAGMNQNNRINLGYIAGILGRDLNERDWKSILRQTTEMGYTEIEIGNYLGESASSFLNFCKEIGLKPIAGGIGWTEDMDTLKESIDRLNALELQYAVSYWPWFTGAPFTLEECKRSAETLNKMGAVCRENGLTLCWHNHDHEFAPLEEGTPFDYLMENTDPELVKCELDIYWVKKGGADPLQIMKKYPGMYPLLHIKDMAPGEDQDFACPGEGIIDWKEIFNEARIQGINHFFVERDNAINGLECLRISAEHLKNEVL